MAISRNISPHKRTLYSAAFWLFIALLLGFVSTIPFVWESKSLWYKLGIDRTFLQSGKVAGLCAAALLLVQIILVLKISLLDKIFGLDRLYLFHQLNGFVIMGLGGVHAALILIPEGINNLPFGWKFWPEFVGGLLFSTLVCIVISAKVYKRFLRYDLWRTIHRPLGYVVIVILSVHVLFVSDSFEEHIPKYGFLLILLFLFLCIVITKVSHLRNSEKNCKIEKITFPTDTLVSLNITVPSSFIFLPGQFVMLQLYGKNLSSEPHPFTIASSPTEEGVVRFIIKKCGDWTGSLDHAEVAHASLFGPFGLFSYATKRNNQNLVFIAAGIGITPFLSMLQSIATEMAKPTVTLIWCLRHTSEMFLRDEFDLLQRQIPGLKIHLVYTREGNTGRLTEDSLKVFLKDFSSNSFLFLCGPDLMMKRTKKQLKTLGFPAKNIFYEKFSL